MVKNVICLLILIVSAFILSSCSNGDDRKFFVSEDKMADERIEQLLAVIKDQDIETLKALFSKQAIGEIEDFDSDIDYLLGFFQGDVESWERIKWSSGGSIENGEKSIMLRSWYKVETDKEEYLFFIIDYPKDTINPDNEGLYTLRVIKAEDKDTQFTYWQDMEIAGIYKPED